MKPVITAIALTMITATFAHAESTKIIRNGSQESFVGPAKYFTGHVIVDRLYGANKHLPQTGGVVTFSPGARSAWHTHPAGQILIVTSGTGWVQEEGGKKRTIKAGDVVWTPPGVKHWHGATSTMSMRHIALSNMRDGKNVIWMEKVSDKQYGK